MSVLHDLRLGERFTDTNRVIADYVLSHLDEMPDMSVQDLAERTFTSNASVVRLCRKLGAKGYQDFKIALLREAERIPSKGLRIDINYPFTERSSPAGVMKNISDVHHYAVDECYSAINALDLQRAASMICAARHVNIFGIGESYDLVDMFARRLLRVGVRALAINLYEETLALSSFATDEDLAILVSYSGDSYVTFAKCHQLLRRIGCPTLLISSDSNIDGFTHRVLYPKLEKRLHNAATFYSSVSTMYVLDAIYGMIYTMEYKRVRPIKDQVDSIMGSPHMPLSLKQGLSAE